MSHVLVGESQGHLKKITYEKIFEIFFSKIMFSVNFFLKNIFSCKKKIFFRKSPQKHGKGGTPKPGLVRIDCTRCNENRNTNDREKSKQTYHTIFSSTYVNTNKLYFPSPTHTKTEITNYMHKQKHKAQKH